MDITCSFLINEDQMREETVSVLKNNKVIIQANVRNIYLFKIKRI
jgi:hypothetical protein